MTRYEEHYLTLPSNGGGAEFTDNTNARFQVRLASPLILEGHGWEVALTSISFPSNPLEKTTNASILKTFPAGTMLAGKTVLTNWESAQAEPRRATTHVDVKVEEVADGQFTVNDGITFVRAVINTLDCKVHEERIKQPTGQFPQDQAPGSGQTPYRRPLWIKEGRRMDQIYEFDSNHTLIINPCDYVFDDLAFTYFNAQLAKAWGILDKKGKLYGPSVRFVYKDQHVLDTAGNVGSTLTYTDSDGVATDVVKLNALVRWEIMNMNTGWFESTFLPEAKTLRVYSNACESRLVGNQRVDVLRELRMDGNRRGQQYYEPRHLEYLPVRRQAFEVLEIHIDDLNGGTVDFGSGVTSVVLHFRRPIN